MLRRFVGGKLHRACITDCNLEYEGSIGIDKQLLERVGMMAGEIVSVFNINNGTRIETYILELPAGSRRVCLNGAAARLGMPSDRIIVLSYTYLTPEEVAAHDMCVVVLDENNEVIDR